MGFVFVPLSTLAFATIANEFRTDATSMFSLVRNMGSGVGISLVTAVLANMVQVNHAELAARLTPASSAVRSQMPGLLTGNPQIVAMADRLVSQQAAMLSYLDDFQLMVWISLASVPIVLLLRGGRPKGDAPEKSAEDLALERAHSIPE
jgi:DHA2 family multidrug resistance protein